MLLEYQVIYCKGLYQFKTKYRLEELKIIYAGPADTMATIWNRAKEILRESHRISTFLRKQLRKLEQHSKDEDYFKSNHITHIIICK